MAKSWKLTIDKKSLTGGWVNNPTGSSGSNVQDGSPNQYSYSSDISLFRYQRIGHISPGEIFTEVNTNSNLFSLPLNGATDSNGNVYFIDNYGTIPGLSAVDLTTINTIHSPPGILASSNANDIIVTFDKAATPVEYLIYSYETTTARYIGYRTPNWATGNDTWMSTNLATGSTIPCVFSFGGGSSEIYFTNKNYIGEISLTATITSVNTITSPTALNLGSGWVASSLAPYKNWLAIVGYRATNFVAGYAAGESKLWLWDGFSPDPNFIYDIGDNYVTAVKNVNGILYIWTKGRNNTTKIKYFNGEKVVPVFEDYGIYHPPRHGAVEVIQNMVHWNNGRSTVYCLDGKSFHSRMTIGDSTAQAGMLRYLGSNYLFAGVCKTSGAYSLYYTDFGYKYSTNSANLITRLFTEIPPRSTIKKFRIYFSQFGSGASIHLSLKKDYKDSGFGGPNDLLYDKFLTNASLGNIYYHSFEANITDVNSFYLQIGFNHSSTSNIAAIIRKIEIEGESTDLY
jgi:hypothetical protein